MTTTTESLERLKLLRDVAFPLARKADEKGLLNFNMFAEDDAEAIDEMYALGHNCGTEACLAGWAAVTPEFNALGLWLNRRGELLFPNAPESHFMWWNLEDLFGLNNDDTDRLFGADHQPDPNDEEYDLPVTQELAARAEFLDTLIYIRERQLKTGQS